MSRYFDTNKELYMYKFSSTLVSLIGVALLAAGCAGPERKLGRGMNNLTEFTRLGELRRSIEQTTVLQDRDLGFTSGAVHGFNRSLERTALGLYEVVTFPIPNHSPKDYGPVMLPENPVYPDCYKPNWLSDQMLSPDTSLGFSGGDIIPIVPGSRFHIFDQ